MNLILLSLLAAVSRLKLAHAQQQELCYWVEEGHSWSSGTKATLNINLDQDYEDWQLVWTMNENIINLEAWKGEVQAYSQSNYTITSRCYNGKLYACEVLSIPFIIRYVPEEGIPEYNLFLNNVPVPPCAMTTTVQPCPYLSYTSSTELCQLWSNYTSLNSASTTLPSSSVSYSSCPYSSIADNVLACQLWCNILETGYSTECTDSPTCPYENYASPHDSELCALWAENNQLKANGLTPYTSTGSTSSPITCIYESSNRVIVTDHVSEYCSLYCENQNMLYNTVCLNQATSTYAPCPYLIYTDQDVLCELWGEINVAEQALSTDSLGNTLPMSTNTIPYSQCPHNNITDSILACYLWCELNALSGAICDNPNSCPYEDYPAPNDERLCAMWYENLELKNQIYGSSNAVVGTATPIFTMGPTNVDCIFIGYAYQSEHCSMWCENEFMKYGSICNAITGQVTDANGNPMTDASGNVITESSNVIITDSNGNAITDANGNALTQAVNVVTDSSGIAVTGITKLILF